MSERRISLNQDIQRLVDEGFEIEQRSGYLIVNSVPYLTGNGSVKRGKLICEVRWAGDIAEPPHTHVAFFGGERPCRANGQQLKHIIGEATRLLAPGVTADFELSSKPPGGSYPDYYEKVTTYVALFEGPAHSIDETVTARTYSPVEPAIDDGVFNYWDTAPGSIAIANATEKLRIPSVGVVGVGGTGSYVLDLLSKCPVGELHIFDGDIVYSHNAFRAPGAPSIDELRQKPKKVEYYATLYGNMHRRVIPHAVFIGAANVELLRGLSFVFLCLDQGRHKKEIVAYLEEQGTPFIDVGMGIDLKSDAVLGTVRVTTSTKTMREHVHASKRIPFADARGANEYSRNVQIADLSSLNAALAVIRWKKWCGFYVDLEHEHFSTYDIDGNALQNEDRE